jgi:ribosomal protein S18 acetylase RimI-like enzyme
MRARLWPELGLAAADLSSCSRIFIADMTAPLIRRATTGDAALLARVGAELFAAAFAAQNDPNDLKAYLATAFIPARQRDELADADRVTWIAESPNGDSAGYAMLKRGAASPAVAANHPAEVQRFYVASTFQGRGLAQALMSVCVEQAHEWGCDAMWLGVWELNPRAVAFYEKCGFRKVGRQDFMVGADRQHDFVMARTL